MTPLEAELREIIAADGPMSVASYMRLCLAHPAHGYYATRDPFGRGGDFITAPEMSQMFGELLGLWAAAVWQMMGSPARVALVELGPGRGTLMADALRAARVVPAFAAALDVHLVETSPVLQRRQQQALAGQDVPIAWHEDFAAVPDEPLIVIANEFFDALPVHQVVKTERGWHERLVGIGADGQLTFALHPDPIPRFMPIAPDVATSAPVGAVYEWGRTVLPIGEAASRIAKDGGAALIVDYGHTKAGLGETLQAVGRHGFVHPLTTPGEVDITTHVDFSALERAVKMDGTRVHGPISQGDFLRRLGIEARAAALRAKATAAQAADIDAALVRLTGSGRESMGELFKAMAFADPRLGALPGFDS
jgi:SAM-dependent MidA family methyltransferase